MRPSLAFLIAAMAIVITAGAADAANRKFCTSYVASVQEGIDVNRDKACGFPETERYLDNPAAHMTWCLGANEDAVREEIGKRTRQVNLCRSCRVYAIDARENSHRNAMWQCGSSGPQWGEDENGHFQWCYASQIDAHGSDLTNVARFIAAQARDRKNRIAQCHASGEEATCRTYADRAVQQSRLAREFLCNVFHGDRFSEDWDLHYGLCRVKMQNATRSGGPERIQQAKHELTLETVAREASNRSACPPLGLCLSYADEAIKLVNEYPGCTGFRWSRSWQDHMNWCNGNFHETRAKTGLVGDPVTAAAFEKMKAEVAARNDELRTCGAKIALPKGSTTKKMLQTLSPPAAPGGGISRVNPNTSSDKSGQGAMDRLGGAPGAPAPSGGFNTAKPGTAPAGAKPPATAAPAAPTERVLPKSKSGF